MNIKPIKPSTGISMFYQAAALKLAFNRLPTEEAIAFAKECIKQGFVAEEDIIAEACAIGGDHIEARFETLLMEGENIHWLRTGDGQLALLPN